MATPKTLQSDVAIIGGGFGGVAAALALTARGKTVTITEEFAWIGGQVSSQALCVLDDLDHPSGETVGVTRRYAEFRARTRDFYRSTYNLSALGRRQLHLCAGNARCSHLTAEPNVAHDCIRAWLEPAVQAGRLKILTGVVPIQAQRDGDRVISITVAPTRADGKPDAAQATTLEARFFLDGGESGDTYPLLNLPYRLGAEAPAEFNEPHAHTQADRTAIQCFTYCAMVEYVPGGQFVGAKPAGYEAIRDKARFYLSGPGASREEPSYFFKPRILKSGARIVPFWFYRCVVDSANFTNATARACINVKCNDFNDAAYLENPRREEVLEQARALTRAYVYWLQTEAPRDEGGVGYPELRAMPEATGTPDGIAQGPYVREGRRLIAAHTVTENDLSAAVQTGARARVFADGVGLGGYAIDIHARSGQPGASIWQPAQPYQVPLSALVTPTLHNFAVAGKGIGVTQVANGAYRMHPSEWSIGEAAGELAAFCLEQNRPATLTPAERLMLQQRMVAAGMPLYWFEDMPFDHPAFAASQLLAVTGVWPGAPDHLRFEGDHSLAHHRKTFLAVMAKLAAAGVRAEAVNELREACLNGHNARKYDVAHQVLLLLEEEGWPASLLGE